MKSNCLIYALRKWAKEGGYLLVRKSHFGWWPHFLHKDNAGVVTHFSPDNPRRHALPPLLFRGEMKEGE